MNKYIDINVGEGQYTISEENRTIDTGVEKQGVWEDVLNKIPTTDVVEIVMCKDCKYEYDCSRNITKRSKNGIIYCSLKYCSEGKRKEELRDEDSSQPYVCPTCRWCLNDWHQEPCTICYHGSKWQDGR